MIDLNVFDPYGLDGEIEQRRTALKACDPFGGAFDDQSDVLSKRSHHDDGSSTFVEDTLAKYARGEF